MRGDRSNHPGVRSSLLCPARREDETFDRRHWLRTEQKIHFLHSSSIAYAMLAAGRCDESLANRLDISAIAVVRIRFTASMFLSALAVL